MEWQLVFLAAGDSDLTRESGWRESLANRQNRSPFVFVSDPPSGIGGKTGRLAISESSQLPVLQQ